MSRLERGPAAATMPIPALSPLRSRALFTGTGFPNVFYLQYHMYRDYFPLLALTECRAAMAQAR